MHPFFLSFVQIITSTPQDKQKDDDLEEQYSSQISRSNNNHREEVKPSKCDYYNGSKLKDAFASLNVNSLYNFWFWRFCYGSLDEVLKNYVNRRKIFINTGRVKICKEQLKKIFADFDFKALFDESLSVEAKNDGERQIADESHSGSAITEQKLQLVEKLASIIRKCIYNKAFDRLKKLLVDDFETYIEKIAEKDTDFLTKELHETLIECLGPKNKDDTKELKREFDPNDEINEIEEKRPRKMFATMKND